VCDQSRIYFWRTLFFLFTSKKAKKEGEAVFWEFYKEGVKRKIWRQEQKILLAVSGGVDSMVLLDLMLQVAKKESLSIAVAHINHQLRQESNEEAAYLRTYCEKVGLPFYQADWQPGSQKTNLEARARTFRYEFFESVMKTAGYQQLLTAHHLDDQAETILMKITRGTAFNNTVGIRYQQKFAGGTLVRPLLSFSKETIRQYAVQEDLLYFEDHTNQSSDYTRNRMRHQVIPLLKTENPRFLQHVASFSQQQALAVQLIQEQIAPKLKTWVRSGNDCWHFSLKSFRKESAAFQYFFLVEFFQETLIKRHSQINQQQMNQVRHLLESEQPQGSISLENHWVFSKSYETVTLSKVKTKTESLSEHLLHLEAGLFLSENTWVGLTADNSLTIPPQTKDWLESSLDLSVNMSLPLKIRHRKAGDKIKLKPNLTKKINRIFIDQKVPNETRDQAWLITNAEDEIIWIPSFANSYLSIPKETDKIHYRLLFKTKE
jgi:tRNA(Ile)-lysidine synthase